MMPVTSARSPSTLRTMSAIMPTVAATWYCFAAAGRDNAARATATSIFLKWIVRFNVDSFLQFVEANRIL